MPLRYNYMYIFLEDFYTNIVHQMTVEEAFHKVKTTLEQDKMQDSRFMN